MSYVVGYLLKRSNWFYFGAVGVKWAIHEVREDYNFIKSIFHFLYLTGSNLGNHLCFCLVIIGIFQMSEGIIFINIYNI